MYYTLLWQIKKKHRFPNFFFCIEIQKPKHTCNSPHQKYMHVSTYYIFVSYRHSEYVLYTRKLYVYK